MAFKEIEFEDFPSEKRKIKCSKDERISRQYKR